MESSAASALKFLSPHHNILVNEKVDVHNVNPSFVQKVYVPIPINNEGQRDFSVSLKTQPNILIGKNFRLNYNIKFTGDNYIPIDPYKMKVFDPTNSRLIYPFIVDQGSLELWPKQFPLNGVMESCSIQINKMSRHITPKNIMHPLSTYSDCEEKWPDGCGKITEEGVTQKMASQNSVTQSFIDPSPAISFSGVKDSSTNYRVPVTTEWIESFENVYPYQDPDNKKGIPSATHGDVNTENADLGTNYDVDELVTKRTLECNFNVNEPIFNPLLDPLNGSDNFSACLSNIDDFWLRFKLEENYTRKLIEFVQGTKYYVSPVQIAPYRFERNATLPEESAFTFSMDADKQNKFRYFTHRHTVLDEIFSLPGPLTPGHPNSVNWDEQWLSFRETCIPAWKTEIVDLTLSYDVFVPIMSIPPIVSSRFNELMNWQQRIELANTGDLQTFKTPQPIEFNYVPEKLFIYIKNELPDPDTNSSIGGKHDHNSQWPNCANLLCQRIESLKMSLNRGKQTIDLKNCADIYTMSKKNGYRCSYNSFHSKTGSVVCIDLTKGDLGDFIPRTRTKFHFTITLTHRNTFGLLHKLPLIIRDTSENVPENNTWAPFDNDQQRFDDNNVNYEGDPRRLGFYQFYDQDITYPVPNDEGNLAIDFVEDSTQHVFDSSFTGSSFGLAATVCVIGSLTGELIIERNRASVSVSNSIEHTNKDMNQQMACYGNYDQSFDTNGPFQSSIDTNTRSNILATCQHLPMRDETALESLVGSKRKR